MEFRKFLMDELKKVSATLSKYEDAFLSPESEDKEYLKASIEYYRTQVADLRKQIYETRTQP